MEDDGGYGEGNGGEFGEGEVLGKDLRGWCRCCCCCDGGAGRVDVCFE